jgi:transposase
MRHVSSDRLVFLDESGANTSMMRSHAWIRRGVVRWIRRRLVPKLRVGDIVIMDNAQAHHDPRVRTAIEACGAQPEYLPPYSPDLNPIEPGWALTKQYIKKMAPRSPHSLRRAAHAGRRQVHERHCRGWFQRAGYRRTGN